MQAAAVAQPAARGAEECAGIEGEGEGRGGVAKEEAEEGGGRGGGGGGRHEEEALLEYDAAAICLERALVMHQLDSSSSSDVLLDPLNSSAFSMQHSRKGLLLQRRGLGREMQVDGEGGACGEACEGGSDEGGGFRALELLLENEMQDIVLQVCLGASVFACGYGREIVMLTVSVTHIQRTGTATRSIMGSCQHTRTHTRECADTWQDRQRE